MPKPMSKTPVMICMMARNLAILAAFEELAAMLYTLFFYIRMLFFPAQAEYSYFSADFRLKIFLYYS